MPQIEFYDTEDGKCPLQEYLDSLEPKILAKTLRTIDLLKRHRRHQSWKLKSLRSIKQIMKGSIKMSNYKDYKEKAFKNPNIKASFNNELGIWDFYGRKGEQFLPPNTCTYENHKLILHNGDGTSTLVGNFHVS